MKIKVQVYHIATLLALTVAALGFATAPNQLPRPWVLFIGVSAALSLLGHRILRYSTPSFFESISIMSEIVLIGFLLRITGYLHLSASGRDTQMWASGISKVINAGHVVNGGMYGASPLYFLEVAVSGIILGPTPRSSSVLGHHNITIVVSSFLPILLAAVATRFASRRTGLLTAILAVSFPLYLRTATLFESEHLALSWFVLLIFFYQYTTNHNDAVIDVVFILLLALSVWLHFFYASIFIGVFISTISVQNKYGLIPLISETKPQMSFVGLFSCGVILVYHILWSDWALQGVGVLSSVLTIPIPTSFSGLFIPSSDAAGASVGGGGGGGGIIGSIVTYFPLAMILVLAGIGGLYSLINSRHYSLEIPSIASILISATLFLLVAQLGYHLQFRMFYFVGTMALVFAGITLERASKFERFPDSLTCIVLSLLILTVAITGSISPMGNNVDPRFGGTNWVTKSTTWTQKEDLGMIAVGNSPLKERTNVFIAGPNPQIHTRQSPNIVLDENKCIGSSEIWDSGDLHGCINTTSS